MLTRCWLPFRSLCAIAALVLVTIPLAAQEAATPTNRVSPDFIPDDAIVAAIASPAEMLRDPRIQMFPLEVFRAQAVQQVGIDPIDVERVKLVVGTPGPGEPGIGVVLEFSRDHAVSELNASLRGDAAPELVDGLQIHSLNLGPGAPPMVVVQPRPRTWIIGTRSYVPKMAKTLVGHGPLAQLVTKVPVESGVTALVVVEPIRPLLVGAAKQQADQLPAELQGLARVPELLDALMIRFSVAGGAGGAQLVALCSDDAAASELERLINESMSFARESALAQVRTNVEGDDPVAQATIAYAERIADMVTAMLKPQRDGKRVRITAESELSIATTGIVFGLLLPAVQAAREAARRVSASGHLKQILLAMHNYHAAYNHLPEPAIRGADGKPLLSWRVAILPFVEQQALYQQFHLDEPWDSPHNRTLIDKMPELYVDPSLPLPPGLTVMQAVVGEEIGLKPNEKTRFRDFLDGTSNSVLVVEANADVAVPWTKPEDVTIDLNQPLANMGAVHAGGFNVAFADGAVKFIMHSIDPELWRSLLTRAALDGVPPAAQE